jgi:hypothetical protein
VAAVGGGLVRSAEWRQVREFAEGARAAPAALAIQGEAGAGKSTLWRAGIRVAADAGHRLLRSEPAASETDLSFAGLSDLLADALPLVAGQIPGPQREALEIALLLRPAGDEPPTARARRVHLPEAGRAHPRRAGPASPPRPYGSVVLRIPGSRGPFLAWRDPCAQRICSRLRPRSVETSTTTGGRRRPAAGATKRNNEDIPHARHRQSHRHLSRRHPHTRPAGPGLHQLHAAGAFRRAHGGARCRDPAPAGPCDVRAGRAAAPAAPGVPRLPGAEPDLRRHLLAELRLGRAGGGDFRARGRVPALGRDAQAHLRQVARARPRATAGPAAGPDQGR